MKIFAAVLFLFASQTVAQSPERETYLKGFEMRARAMTAPYDTVGGYGGVAARYAHNVNVAQADSLFIAALKEPRGDMFWMFPVMGAYLHGKGKMAPAVEEAVRHAWKTYTPYRGDTENHWAMYHAAFYLAAEQWPGLPGSEWFNGKSSEENLRETREYLIHWMKITTMIGQGEFDSPDYLPEFAIPMSLLADFARDPEMRLRGEMMLDYLLADFAVEHLDGQYLGGFSRIYQPAVYKPLLSGASTFAYLYFGTGERVGAGWALLPALGKYRLPEIIYHIAIDRDKPYVERERKRVRNVIRFGKEKNPPVYKYTYVTQQYGIGSLHGGILQPIQQHTWGVRYRYGRPYTTIFGLHPYWSGEELGMFFPEDIMPLMADVLASKGTYNNPDKWTGGSPYERTFQHKNTLLVLYDIAAGTTSEHIDGFFPRNLEQRNVDSSGWILCKAGDTYIGWYPLQPYEWIEEHDTPGQVKNVEGRPTNTLDRSQEVGYWRLRSHQLQNGYVIEVRSKHEAGSFEKFSASLRRHIPKKVLTRGMVAVDYSTLDNQKMSFRFPDKRMLDGKQVDLGRTRLFEGPFLNAEVGSEMLTLTSRGARMVLDFKNVRIVQ
jgi:hypothetical protein